MTPKAVKPLSDAADDVSLSTIYHLLTGMAESIRGIEGHLGHLNGDVSHLKDRDKSHSQQLGKLTEGHTGLASRVTALEAVGDVERHYTTREMDDVKSRQTAQLAKLWEIGMKVAGTLAVLGILANLVMDWIK